jgi:hypothetical protein
MTTDSIDVAGRPPQATLTTAADLLALFDAGASAKTS